jgi:hypothetical protein
VDQEHCDAVLPFEALDLSITAMVTINESLDPQLFRLIGYQCKASEMASHLIAAAGLDEADLGTEASYLHKALSLSAGTVALDENERGPL